MKTLRLLIVLLASGCSLAAAKPRLYVTGQAGWYNADAGSPAASMLYVDEGIKSGPKSFVDFSLGAEFNRWFSLEAGYVKFAGFHSAVFLLRPGFLPTRPEAIWMTYDLQGYRVTPVVRVYSTKRLVLEILGGAIHPTGKVVRRDYTSPSSSLSLSFPDYTYHYGAGASCRLSTHTTLEGRIIRYDFGKPEHDSNRVTAMTYSLGLSWRF